MLPLMHTNTETQPAKERKTMKSFTINIHPKLESVTFTVKNGKEFSKNLIAGTYKGFKITIDENDLARVKKVAVEIGNDNNSNKGKWYAHCNGFAMDLMISYNGEASINTYRPYGKEKKYNG